MTDYKLAGVTLHEPSKLSRMAILLWGPSGCGKTTFAATAPGKKLLLSFDPDGFASLAHRDDVLVADFATAKETLLSKFDSDDPLGVTKIINEAEIDTVIVDSLTSVAELALTHGIHVTKGATNERPSPGAYQARNRYTLLLIRNMLRVTKKLDKHCIIIAHEADPVKDKEGNVMFISIMLGGQLPNQSGISLNEVWNMTDTGKARRIAVRQCRMHQPMKTRMYRATAARPEFNVPDGTDDFLMREFDRWRDAEFQKIPLPA